MPYFYAEENKAVNYIVGVHTIALEYLTGTSFLCQRYQFHSQRPEGSNQRESGLVFNADVPYTLELETDLRTTDNKILQQNSNPPIVASAV